MNATCPCKHTQPIAKPSGKVICKNCGGKVEVVVEEKPRA